jgi:OFA family oxalate/formate antiporter-like MFS transporter
MKRGWLIVLAGIGINLSFGVLYAWSIFAKNLREINGWTASEASLPYTMAIIMFAVLMIPGGRLQDKMGPRFVVVLAGALIGSGMILSSFVSTSSVLLAITFGVLGGAGIGLGYSATTPVAVKWFPPSKKGLISGLVVGGFGLAPLYIAPLTKMLIASMGIAGTFRSLGFLFLGVVVVLGMTLKNPEKPAADAPSTAPGVVQKPAGKDYVWQEMIKTVQFKQLWVMFFVGAVAGLMIIGHLATIVSEQSNGLVNASAVVMIASIANALGRPAAGVISDKIGRAKTMMVLYALQGTALVLYSTFSSFILLTLGACIITFGYGAMLAVYPSAAGDFYGAKNLGLNYGVLFSAWGVGGIVGPQLAGFFLDATGTYQTAFYTAAALCFVGAFIGFILKPVKHS